MFLSDADLALFSTVGEILIILGLVGGVSLFVSRRDRHIQDLSLGLLFTLMAASGGALVWRTDELGKADRDLLLRIAETVYQQTAPDGAKAKIPPAPGKPS